MKHPVQKDIKKRSRFEKLEAERRLLKTISSNRNVPSSFRWKADLLLSDLPRKGSLAQIHKRCVLSGRARFLVKGFNLSRFMLRKLAQEGSLAGLRKACW